MSGILASPNKTASKKTSPVETSPKTGLVALLTLLLPLSLAVGAASAAGAPKVPANVAKETSGYAPRTTYYDGYFGLSARTRNAQRLSHRLGAKQEPAPGTVGEVDKTR